MRISPATEHSLQHFASVSPWNGSSRVLSENDPALTNVQLPQRTALRANYAFKMQQPARQGSRAHLMAPLLLTGWPHDDKCVVHKVQVHRVYMACTAAHW